MLICRACATKHQILIVESKRTITLGVCLICRKYSGLHKVSENTASPNLGRAQDLVALRTIDDVLARGGQ